MKFLPILLPPFPSLLRESDGYDNYDCRNSLYQSEEDRFFTEMQPEVEKLPVWKRPKKKFTKAPPPERPAGRRRKRRLDVLQMLIKFSNATLGKEDTVVVRPQLEIDEQIFARLLGSFDPIHGQLELEKREREKRHKHNVEVESLQYLRSSFKHQQVNGALRRPQIHVEFSNPKNCEEFCCCVTTDFLYVVVGLTNILVLQFVLVVILFLDQHPEYLQMESSDLLYYSNFPAANGSFDAEEAAKLTFN